MRSRLDAFGRTDLSNAVRPAVFSPGRVEAVLPGVVLQRLRRVRRRHRPDHPGQELPKNPATSDDRTTWVNDSRHHGLSMSPDGSKLCVAGTMDDYATVVDRATLQEGPLVTASKPYWATVSGDGKDCVISESGADQVTAISFATGQKVASVPVGDHPQRVRIGHVPHPYRTADQRRRRHRQRAQHRCRTTPTTPTTSSGSAGTPASSTRATA
jgi:DNA-binding beta-propeller fold protein YncE